MFQRKKYSNNLSVHDRMKFLKVQAKAELGLII